MPLAPRRRKEIKSFMLVGALIIIPIVANCYLLEPLRLPRGKSAETWWRDILMVKVKMVTAVVWMVAIWSRQR